MAYTTENTDRKIDEDPAHGLHNGKHGTGKKTNALLVAYTTENTDKEKDEETADGKNYLLGNQ